MDRNRSCPFVSHICSRTRRQFSVMRLTRKSTPTVETVRPSKESSVNLHQRRKSQHSVACPRRAYGNLRHRGLREHTRGRGDS